MRGPRIQVQCHRCGYKAPLLKDGTVGTHRAYRIGGLFSDENCEGSREPARHAGHVSEAHWKFSLA